MLEFSFLGNGARTGGCVVVFRETLLGWFSREPKGNQPLWGGPLRYVQICEVDKSGTPIRHKTCLAQRVGGGVK